MNGMFIFPDVFTWPASVKTQPTGINEAAAGYTNTYTYNDFKRLQDAGIVFLPAAGFRSGGIGDTLTYSVGSEGYYWSASPKHSDSAYDLYFNDSVVITSNHLPRYQAYSVRLVTDVK